MNRYIVSGVAVLLLLFGAASCTDQPSTLPSDSGPNFIRVLPDQPEGQALGRGGGQPGGANAATGEISVLVNNVTGGIVATGRYVLTIPPGALDEPTLITLKPQEANGLIQCQFKPNGLTFRTPALFSIDLKQTNVPNGADVQVWWSSDEVQWDCIGGTYFPSVKVVTAQVVHFSSGRAGW